MAPTSDAAARAGDATAPPVPSPARGRRAPECFDDPHFLAATREMQALGLRVMAIAHAGSAPFDAVAGRMQLRWYLLPAGPRAVSVASLALMQPLRRRARIGKRIMTGAARLSLPHLWRRSRVHVSGTNRLAALFGPGTAHAAFLTGTAGPHRKLAVQFMDDSGVIRGYAKVARTPAAQELLANEAATLAALRDLDLRAAMVPRLLLHERRDGVAVLATDAARAQHAPCRARLERAHIAFLDELAKRTAASAPDGDALLDGLRAKVRRLPASLTDAWRQRFDRSLRELARAPELVAPRGLAHGDLMPGNLFRYEDRVYVFDWEYAGYDYPADYDLIRFAFAAEALRHRAPIDRCRAVESKLIRDLGRSRNAARVRLIAYLCAQALLLAGRRSGRAGEPLTWEGEPGATRMLDALGGQGPVAW